MIKYFMHILFVLTHMFLGVCMASDFIPIDEDFLEAFSKPVKIEDPYLGKDILFEENKDFMFTVYNVGQGNFLLFKVFSKYFIVDCGSSSFKAELYSTNTLEGKEFTETFLPGTPIHQSATPKPISAKRRRMYNLKDMDMPTSYNPKVEIFKEIQELFKVENGEDENYLYVKTVVITHADKDHYNWIPLLLSYDLSVKVDHIVLGGLPISYQNTDLHPWLIRSFEKGSAIYFPAISNKKIMLKQDNAIDTDNWYLTLDEFSDLFKDTNPAVMGILYGPMKDLFMKDAFTVNEAVTFDCLGINTMHFPSHIPGKYIRNLNKNSEINCDSIALKVTYNEKSIICLGDMEGKNLNILQDIWTHNPTMLQTDILVASHHGAFENDCNSVDFIKLCQPKIVVFSHGFTSFGHPRLQTYENIKQVNSLAWLPQSKGINFGAESKVGRVRNRYEFWKVYHALFSTLHDGDLIFGFNKKDIIDVMTMMHTYEINVAHKEINSIPGTDDEKIAELIFEDETIGIVGDKRSMAKAIPLDLFSPSPLKKSKR